MMSAKCLTHFQRFKPTNIRYYKLQLLADDGRRCLQMSFACIQKHSFEIYESSLVWLPKKSLIRIVYAANIRRVPRVILGLSNMWGSTVLHMENGSVMNSVAFSQDGSRVVSGSNDSKVRIWNATTGEVEAGPHELGVLCYIYLKNSTVTDRDDIASASAMMQQYSEFIASRSQYHRLVSYQVSYLSLE